MMMRLLVIFCVFTFAHSALAQDTLSYQGHLSNAAGNLVDASYPMVFKLYDMRDGGEALWTESYDSVDVIDGTFTVELGSQTPFSNGIADYPELYLGVSVNDAREMSPRLKLSTVLRAKWAAHAKDVRGENIHPNSVSINDVEVINSDGQWVGDSPGLRGEQGPPGLPGAPGIPGEQGPAGPGFDVTLDTDTDGFADWLEVMVGTDPTDESSVPADGDQDNIPDVLRGPQGVAGADGQPGANGVNGNDGQNGADGATILDAEIDDNGQLKLYMSDMRLITAAGSARGPAGAGLVLDFDSDNDGFADWIEVLAETDPTLADSKPADTDQNGVADVLQGATGAKGEKGDKGNPGDAGGFVDGVNLGDTARWDGTQWVVDSALSNTGNGVGVLTGTPHPSAALEVSSTTGGFLMPRMTSGERDALLNPTPGLMVFNLTTGCFNHWSGAVWKELCASCEAPFVTPVINGDNAVLCGADAVTYSVPEIAGANAYTWSIPAGATLVSGQGTSSISVDFGTSAGGNVEVIASGECPNSAPGQLLVGVATTSGSVTFEYTGAFQTFTVPPCANSLSVDLRGGQGGTGLAGAGGLGGQVSGELAVYPGQELYVYVGGEATATGNNALGGWNGGGNASSSPSAGGGGGASDIRTLSGPWDDLTSLESRLMVAAGGGGAGFRGADSRGGGLSSFGKYPASQTASGQGGGFGKGADAVYCGCGYYSGGGGGGWYGGGSHGNSGLETGSGGSSYYGGVGVTQGSTLPGVNPGPGTVTISW